MNNMKFWTFIPICIVLIFLSSCENNDTIKVRGIVWDKKNLCSTSFRNGDSIQCADDSLLWRQLCNEKKPAYCHVPNDSCNLGVLYNYWAMIDSRTVAPWGWHVATVEEWEKTIAVDSMELRDVEGNIYEVNKLNIQKSTIRICDYLDDGMYWFDFVDGTSFWAYDNKLCCESYVLERIFPDECEYLCIYESNPEWNFDEYDEIENPYALSPFRGCAIRCVKD